MQTGTLKPEKMIVTSFGKVAVPCDLLLLKDQASLEIGLDLDLAELLLGWNAIKSLIKKSPMMQVFSFFFNINSQGRHRAF